MSVCNFSDDRGAICGFVLLFGRDLVMSSNYAY